MRVQRDIARADVAASALATARGPFLAVAFRDPVDRHEHLALVAGEVAGHEEVLVRVHSECLTGDLFGARRCDCGEQLDAALDAITAAGRGVLVYLRGHEGRGMGLV
ncbi:MAG: GTP cyclohydrolase II, partial [Thermocrispum sp.]